MEERELSKTALGVNQQLARPAPFAPWLVRGMHLPHQRSDFIQIGFAEAGLVQ
jgi:hypothetical protein